MKNSTVLLALLGIVACHGQTRLPPSPKEFPTTLLPSAIITTAETELVARGFEITSSKPDRGFIGAQRTARGSDNNQFIVCKNRLGEEGNLATASLVTQVSVFISAIPSQLHGSRGARSGSNVSIRTGVVASFIDTPKGVKPKANDDCVSSGVIEGRLIDLLSR